MRYADPSGWDAEAVALQDSLAQKYKAPVAATGEAVDCILDATAQVLLAVAFDQLNGETLFYIAKTGALTPIHRDKLLDIRIEGEATPLRPSTGHPFWVKRGDSAGAWIAAGEMRVGDLVQTIDGQWKRVVAITPEKDSQTVYNFTVDLNHDYFVGYQGLLVHNAPNCNCRSGNFQHEFKHAPKFGVNGPWNKANAALFEQALQAIINGPNTVPYPVDFGPPGRSGSFTGGTAYLDQPSGLCVGFDPGGDLAFAWELGARQVEGLVVNGTLW